MEAGPADRPQRWCDRERAGDLAAADLILSEAGGNVLTAKGKALTYGLRNTQRGDYRHGALVAASGLLMDNMLNIVADTAFG